MAHIDKPEQGGRNSICNLILLSLLPAVRRCNPGAQTQSSIFLWTVSGRNKPVAADPMAAMYQSPA